MKFEIQELRPAVLAYAWLMEKRLREKDAEKSESWKTQSAKNLAVHATSKMLRMEESIRLDFPHSASKHAVDAGNYCMMISDVNGTLDY